MKTQGICLDNNSHNDRLKILRIYCFRHYSKCFLCINTFNPHNCPRQSLVLYSIYVKKQKQRKLKSPDKITEILSGRARIRTYEIWLKSMCFHNCDIMLWWQWCLVSLCLGLYLLILKAENGGSEKFQSREPLVWDVWVSFGNLREFRFWRCHGLIIYSNQNTPVTAWEVCWNPCLEQWWMWSMKDMPGGGKKNASAIAI